MTVDPRVAAVEPWECSSVRDAGGTPAWGFYWPDHVRPDGMPTVVTDPRQLETPLLQRILTALRKDFDPEFSIRWLGPVPNALLRQPLPASRLVLVTTGCLHLKEDRPFDPYADRWGDPTYRWIPHLTPPDALALDADYVDEKYIRKDPEVALPMDALQHWANEGLVGGAAPRHLSFCEGVVRPFPSLIESAREAIRTLKQDQVDGALLFPSCSLCVLNVCVVAREIEAAGIPTSTVSLLPELTRIVGVPRSVAVRFPLGAPCGDPGNRALHRHVVRVLLEELSQSADSSRAVTLDVAWRSGSAPDQSGIV